MAGVLDKSMALEPKFFALPRELRDLIYGYAHKVERATNYLMIKDITPTTPSADIICQRPFLGPMLVSRKFGEEYRQSAEYHCIITGKLYMAYNTILRQPVSFKGIRSLHVDLLPAGDEHDNKDIAHFTAWGEIFAQALIKYLPALHTTDLFNAGMSMPDEDSREAFCKGMSSIPNLAEVLVYDAAETGRRSSRTQCEADGECIRFGQVMWMRRRINE